jgi:hypothetical protein
LYTHLRQDGRGLVIDPGAELLIPLPPDRVIVEVVDGPEGSAEESEEIIQKTAFGVLRVTWIRISPLIQASG